eukprot:Polyplicarium_translucidae@DN757_c0_g1_i3.p1
MLKPLLPQLHTTFSRCLLDEVRAVRTLALQGLGLNCALAPARSDAILGDFCTNAQSHANPDIRMTMLLAVAEVLKLHPKTCDLAVAEKLYACAEEALNSSVVEGMPAAAAAALAGVACHMPTGSAIIAERLRSLKDESIRITFVNHLMNPEPIGRVLDMGIAGPVMEALRAGLKSERRPLRKLALQGLFALMESCRFSESGPAEPIRKLLADILPTGVECLQQECIKEAPQELCGAMMGLRLAFRVADFPASASAPKLLQQANSLASFAGASQVPGVKRLAESLLRQITCLLPEA